MWDECQNARMSESKLLGYTWCKLLICFNYQFNFENKMFQICQIFSNVIDSAFEKIRFYYTRWFLNICCKSILDLKNKYLIE